MPRVYVSIGSNIDKEKNVRAAIKALHDLYQPLTLSSVYESVAVGFRGDNFYNLVAGFDTTAAVEEVAARLIGIEDSYGRRRSGHGFEPRTLDLDLLLYGDLQRHDHRIDVPRQEINQYAFVLRPLAEIAPELKHPGTAMTLAESWRKFTDESQKLWPVEFDFGL
ncbi:MAG: 2-amino-4-hydroxy-6-hydroxymethyldihydropteridine diphosphokinase [Gammaproteobacteria bacterium]|nr:MAG: 2-amino-4-hydroxy-6-hydroxymethyldihydropteridine diphosphokinase [Gammaproteobacteria bacterium]